MVYTSFFGCLLFFFFCSTLISGLKIFSRDKSNNDNSSLLKILTASYNQNTAIRNLYFAYAAYCNESSLLHWNCKWCEELPNFDLTYLSTKDELQVFVGYDNDGDQIIVSFRGTHNIYDWLDDMDATKVSYPGVSGGEVHKGFYDAWKVLEKGVMNATQLLMDKYFKTSVLITGHSLGAALSQLAAINIKGYANETNNTAQINLYHYGSPRWANEIMVEYFEYQVNENWRLVNHHDIVPTVPPEDLGYHHTYFEVWYEEYKPTLQYVICNNNGEDQSCDYIEKSVEDHLWYLDIHEECPGN